MANPLYGTIPNGNMNNNALSQFIQQVKKFKKSFQGNPRDEVQRLLNSGQMSQAEFNQYSQIAKQIAGIMGQ